MINFHPCHRQEPGEPCSARAQPQGARAPGGQTCTPLAPSPAGVTGPHYPRRIPCQARSSLQTQRGTEGAQSPSSTPSSSLSQFPWAPLGLEVLTPRWHRCPALVFGHRHAANFAFSSPSRSPGGVRAARAHKEPWPNICTAPPRAGWKAEGCCGDGFNHDIRPSNG